MHTIVFVIFLQTGTVLNLILVNFKDYRNFIFIDFC